MPQTIYCSQCGDPSPLGQRFCEKCGSRLPTSDPMENLQETQIHQGKTIYQQNSSQTPPPSNNSRGLFDPNHMSYVLKEKYWDFGSGPIYDAAGRQIGSMKRKLLSIRSRIELYEANGQLAGAINRKLIAIKPTYTLHDEYDNNIGRFEKTLLSIIHPKFYLKDTSGNIVMTAQGEFMGFDFKIRRGTSTDDRDLIAEIRKADRWKDVFFSGAWDFGDTYGVRIHNPSVDRRLLIGFVIAIDNVLHDN
ncbi:hypothetical protein NEF87_000664 [Candidatus Lokiarchaeum ossiferum]|uniref:Zinc-ribbon domain-containing protein n=1 Tax=Candidatus Lokiarchaeum ossiferum TaxID=2951803 RepID=A0ABY6HLJ1_9ARCH|nr:hypothetical protein NEF87_000664 [Candidatus Lokiarchaeum sp. B-35]